MTARDITRDEWLQLRTQSIGASEAAAACGEDPSVSPLELVCRKRGLIPDEDLSSVEAIRWGNILEPAIVHEAARRAGVRLLDRHEIEAALDGDERTELVGFVEGAHPFLRSRARPWQTATLDGLGYAAALGLVSIEAKNVGFYLGGYWEEGYTPEPSEDQAAFDSGRAPDKFRLQVAHQLAVAPAISTGILSGLVGGNSLRSVHLERAQLVVTIDAMIAIEESVWGCVQSGTMPELSGPPASVARALKAIHPDDTGETIILPGAVAECVRTWRAACAAKSLAEKEAEIALNEIKAALGDATFGEMPDGSGTFSLKTTERGEYVSPACKYRKPHFKKTKAPKSGAKKS